MDTTDSLTAPMPIRRYSGRIAVLLGLVALADFLIFGQEPGINLFLFALAVCAGILLPATKELSPSKAALLLGLSLPASAPLLETPSAMGFALCLTALMSVALVSGKLMPRSLTGLPLAFSRFALVIPLRLAEDVGKYLATPAKRSSSPKSGGAPASGSCRSFSHQCSCSSLQRQIPLSRSRCAASVLTFC